MIDSPFTNSVAHCTASDIEKSLVWEEFITELNKVYATLSDDEKFTMEHRYGFGGGELLSFSQIGRSLSMTPSRAYQVFMGVHHKVRLRIPVREYRDFVL